MFTALLVLTILCSIAVILSGILAFLSDQKSLLNQRFLMLSVCLGLWVPVNFLGSNVVHEQLTVAFIDFDFSLAIFIGWFMMYFVEAFLPQEKRSYILSSKKVFYSTLLLNLVLVAAIWADLVVNVSLSSGDLVVTSLKPFIIYVAVLLTYMIIAFGRLVYIYRKTEHAKQKAINIIFFGFLVAAIANVATNIIFPEITNNRETLRALNIIGYLGILFLVLSIYLAITTKRLFDIRLVVVRTLGYVLSLGTIIIATSFVIFGLSNVLISLGVSQDVRLWLYVFITLLFSVSYQPIKQLFDKITNKLFYRDAYETQILLNEFNQVIVSTIDLNQLLTRAGVVIEKYLKPENVSFALRDTEVDTIRIISATDVKVAKEAVEQIRSYVHKSEDKLFVTDALEESQSELKQLMQEANIGMLARVTTDTSVEGNGYIVMGYKKSGNMYNTQDTGAMEIIANELAIAMQNALQFEEIQKFNVTLQEKVEQATRKLQKTNEKLKALDETKDEFISMASHQLRTPLTSVKGYLSMVIEGDAGELNEMQHKLLDQAFVSSQRMVYLIADLLNVSRLRTGKFIIEAAPTNLADVIQGEVEQLVETASSRGLTLKYNKPENFPTLMLDETKVRQVIMNFIDNAIYYTPSGGNIVVNLKDLGTSIEYTVVDDGIGVPKSEQHHLFSKFYRAGNAKKARPDGTGLGLFMARKVIVAQGGSIVFKSTEGKGSTFGFTFAKDKLAAAANSEKQTAE